MFINLKISLTHINSNYTMKTSQILLSALFALHSLLSNAQNTNTLLGDVSGRDLTTGASNTFIGGASGAHCTTGNNNTALGFWSGLNLNGENNLYLGAFAGQENMTGSNNTILGTYAGFDNSNYSGNILIGYSAGYFESASNKLYIENTDSSTPIIWGDFAQDQLKFNAKVGIGYGFGNYPTTTGSVNINNYNLFVKGGILTEEVRVSLQNTWADYVFAKDYKLPTLKEVENHIITKGHLINVPSATEVKANGIELGEMAKIQQEKIEELTLYIIEQNKINEKQAKLIQSLEERLTKLETKK